MPSGGFLPRGTASEKVSEPAPAPPPESPPESPPVSRPAAPAVPPQAPPEGEKGYEPDESLAKSWDRLLKKLAVRDPSLKAVLGNSELLRVDEEVVEIELRGSKFTLDRVRRKESIALIEAVCSDYFGTPRKLAIKVKEQARTDEREKQREAARLKQEALNHPLVADAIEVFEGKVVDVKIL